jgi:hypothetical protein
MDLKIKKLIFEANGFYQDCCNIEGLNYERM